MHRPDGGRVIVEVIEPPTIHYSVSGVASPTGRAAQGSVAQW
jgi:hypothetical protein